MESVTTARDARRLVVPGACAGLVVVGAVVWVHVGGGATARFVRRVFEALDPVVMLEIAAGLALIGVASALLGTYVWPEVSWPESLRRRATGAIGRVPAIVSLSVIVCLAAVFRIVLGAASHTPKVLGDELVYTGLAKSWALHGRPLLRGTTDVGHSTLYPLLIAPAMKLATDGADALAAVRTMNAIAMAVTAIPAYLLARRVVSDSWALVVAALSVAVPWTVYAALTMTESLFYPVFVSFAAVLAWTIESPTWRRQIAMLVLLAALVGVRAQGLSVALGAIAAIVLFAVRSGGLRALPRRYALTLGVFAFAVLIGVVAAVAGVAVPTSAYNSVFDYASRLGGMLKWGLWSVGSFALALGVTALAAFPVALVAMLRRTASAQERAAAAVASMLTLAVLGSVALLSAGPYGLGVLHERSLFYVTPLVLVCLAHWLERGLVRPFWLSLACALGAVGVVAALPRHVVFRTNDVDVPSSSFFLALDERISSVGFHFWAIAIAVVGAATFLVARRTLFPIVTVAVAFVAIATQVDYTDGLSTQQAHTLAWVDRTLPEGTTATLVYVGFGFPASNPCAGPALVEQQDLTTWTEFFNRSVDRVVHLYAPNVRDGLTSKEVTATAGGLALQGGRPFRPLYVVLDSRQPIVGQRIGRFDLGSVDASYPNGSSLTLWKAVPPLRLLAHAQPLPERADGAGC